MSELEKLGLKASRPGRPAPTLAWRGDKDWLFFKSTYRVGDRIRPFEASFKLGERPYVWGYALMRGDCLLLEWVTRIA